jgi:hypothetical protein
MTMIRPNERAWLDQQDARLRDAVELVLVGVRRVASEPELLKGISAMNVGAALHEHLDALDEEETRALAHHAVTRLAEQIYFGANR